MKGDIVVEAGAPLPEPGTTTTTATTTTTTTTGAPPTPPPLVRRLAGSVGPGATIALRVGARGLFRVT
jgi:hypothetical protein